MTGAEQTASDAEDQPLIVDVWSRTSRRYRRRSIIMLSLLALLFAGLCCFTFWLRTGDYAPWASEAYGNLLAQSLRPSGTSQITLTDFLSAPISVKEVPIHGLIMGLLLASLSSIPILVAILYRFPFSIVFAVMVMFLAAMPWLGATILLGCAVPALRPFRFSFRYASALVGLIPVAVYFVSASWEPAAPLPRLVQHQALLYAPWVLAVLGSCVICAVALAIARLINYRPGGIPPVLAMLFAVPVFLFHTQVGRDELEYRLLEQEVGPGSRMLFQTKDVGAEAAREATRRWSRAKDVLYDEVHRRMLKRAISYALLKTEQDRARAVSMCDSFLDHFPKSRHVAAVLFLKGRAQDQRLQRVSLERHRVVEYRSDLPNRASQRTWETLLEQFPHTEQDITGTARYKLATLDTRDGRIDAAIAHLDELVRRFEAARSTTQPQAPGAGEKPSVFGRLPASHGLGVDLTTLVRRARRLREMLAACRADAARPRGEVFGESCGNTSEPLHPVQLLLWLDDTDPRYKANLEGIMRHFEDSVTRGYVEIRLALLERAISRRIQRFENAATSLSGSPAGATALYYLGDALQQDSLHDEARTRFDELTKGYPDSCWAQEAKDRVSSLSMLDLVGE